MTTLKIDIRNMGASAHPDDRVILYAPEIRARIGGGLVSTAPLEVELVDGQATVENVEPGPIIVRFECLGIADTTEKRGIVPDSGVVTLDDVLELKHTWTPPVLSFGLKMIIDAMNTALIAVNSSVNEAITQAVESQFGGLVRAAEDAAQEASASASAAHGAALSANVRATAAESAYAGIRTRVEAIEALASLSPGTPADGQTATLVSQVGSLTRKAINAVLSVTSPGIINAANPPAGLTPVVADGHYYDPARFKYFQDAEMTIPATDNAPALQALVDYTHNIGGGTIELPRGKIVTRKAVLWKTGVSMRGAGKVVTRVCAEGVLFSVFTYDTSLPSSGAGGDDPNTQWLENVKFTDFAVDNRGLSSPDPSVSGKAFFLLYMKQPVFRDLVIVNTIGTGLGCDFLIDATVDSIVVRNAGRNTRTGYGGNSGIGIGTAARSKEPLVVSNCFVYDCGNYGIFVETQNNPDNPYRSAYAKIVNCHAERNYRGFGNKGSGPTQWIGCTAVENTTYGFELLQGAYGDKVLGCVASRNGYTGIAVSAPYTGDIMIDATEANENGNYGMLINLGGSTNRMKNVAVTGCETARNGWSGIATGGPISNLTVANCRAFSNGHKATISAHRRGLFLNGGHDIVTLTGNTVFDDQETKTQDVGIQVDTAANRVVMSGNNAPGYSLANAYQYPAEKTVFEANSPSSRIRGTATFTEGAQLLWVTHNRGRAPAEIALTPLGNARVWVVSSEPNRMRISRESTGGQLDVMWAVS
ncbi:hypothetical protein HMPREF0290_0863 [Corynebacterium efficiens YS-314]|uniref:right-handed parallel beta-helix repeat-containing protein n=1 Tax=Corynebacterium efficiens TaxID=152794 RepID=UPI0001B86E2D|nr:right-handed parallel beta-helix repeat-containing protein [Corynebacterium efficiens]EEW50415.1 hypothetical protein HMPREF0290_0863 [Corynebacterium efficiens YS-314]